MFKDIDAFITTLLGSSWRRNRGETVLAVYKVGKREHLRRTEMGVKLSKSYGVPTLYAYVGSDPYPHEEVREHPDVWQLVYKRRTPFVEGDAFVVIGKRL